MHAAHPNIAKGLDGTPLPPWDGRLAPFRAPFALRLAYLLYQLLIHLLVPVFLVFLWRRGRREPLYRAHISQRLGFGPGGRKGDVLIYASSLGETRAVLPLVRLLLDDGYPVLMTHASAAGLEAGRNLLGDEIRAGRVRQHYQPIDAAIPLWLFLLRQRPRVALVVECELWPGFLFETRRFGVPVVLLNGSYTERAHIRDKSKLGGLRLKLWPAFTRVTTKSETHRGRFHRAGLPLDHIWNLGELKFDLPPNAKQVDAAGAARDALLKASGARNVWMIASSIEGEEEKLSQAIEILHAGLDKPPLIVWVPRSPQRFAAVVAAAHQRGYRVGRRSDLFEGFQARKIPPLDILVGDSIGEMDFYYAMADIVFVGATLFPMGGHNPIEPLALEKPVVTGPSIYGVAYPAYEARDLGALREYPDSAALAANLVTLFSDPKELRAFSGKAKGFIDQHKGAAARTLVALKPALDRSP